MRFFIWLMIFCFFGGLVSVTRGAGAQQEENVARLRSNILALERVQENIRNEVAESGKEGAPGLQQRNELVLLLGYLRERNREYCRRIVELSGRAAVADLPCPPEQERLPQVKSRTLEEELAALDESLSASLGAFDEMLLREQERIAARQPRARESGGPGGGGNGAGSAGSGAAGTQGASGGGTGSDGNSDRPGLSGQGRTPTAGSGAAAGQPGQVGGQAAGGVPADRDRMRADDDIVARQLREAAEKETDPELKEKLWQEYRKYREGR